MRTGGMSEHDDRRLLVVDFIDVNVIRGVSSTVPFPCLSHRLCAREGRFPFDIKDMIWGHQRKQTLHISRIDAMDILSNDLLRIHLSPSLGNYSLPPAYANLKRKATTCHCIMVKHNQSGSIPSLEPRPGDERKI
jgi:hypothetical protein